MTLELKPLGNSCNLACTYCYQEPMRLAGNVRTTNKYDLDLMMKIADESGQAEGHGYALFGGEALLIPKKDLRKLLKASFEKYKGGSIQTNGSLIDDEHIQMFKDYNIHIGISIDGPNDLNGMRVSASPNKTTQELTQATMDNLVKLAQNNISVGIILTLHKLNGTRETLPRFLNFLRWLGDVGIPAGNIHMLEVDSKAASDHCLSPEENEWAFLKIAEFLDRPENRDLHYNPFKEMEDLQRSDDSSAHCVWKSCDPMNTGAVYGIEGDGQLSNCGMVNKEGIEWTKADDGQKYLRDIVLYQTPPENGGCKGCPYFLLCNGYCPGSSLDSDWRNKTYYCSSLKKMFKYYEEKLEQKGVVPHSKRADRLQLEAKYFDILLNRPHDRYLIQDLIKENSNQRQVSSSQRRVISVRE